MWHLLILALVNGQILDFPGVTYVDNCYPYECNLQGICTNLTGNTYMCDCFTFYEGDNCENTLETCENVDCGDAGTCLYDDALPKCFCEYGWEKEDPDDRTSACSVEISGLSPCDVYDCGGQGECFMDDSIPKCECNPGWGGDTCTWQNRDVYNMYLLEIAALLTDMWPEQSENIAYDCSYLWPFVWEESPVALEIGPHSEEVLAPCNCLTAIKEIGAGNSWETLYQWRLDAKYQSNMDELHELHCAYDVTQEDVDEFTAELSSFNDDCAKVLSDETFPLYLENEMMCSCLTAVADSEDDIRGYLQPPLDLAKPYSSAYMNYQACTSDDGVCDYEDIYSMIMQDSANYLEIAEACAPVVMTMAKSTDLSDYEDDMCTCMEKVFTYCVDCGKTWFSCRASTWDWTTVENRFKQMCFDAKKIWREYVWTMNRYTMQLFSIDVMGASSCSNAMMTSIGRAQVPLGIDDYVMQTMCDCMNSLAANGFDTAWDEVMALAPTGFSLEESDCEADDVETLSAKVDLSGEGTAQITMTADAELSSTDSTQIVIMVILCILVGCNVIWLARNCKKNKSYGKLDDSVANSVGEDYKTTGER